jgi:hypothetical protein
VYGQGTLVSAEQCFGGLCFVPLDPSGPKFFGFSEFFTGLALMVLAWTIADVRYRFRVWTAPIPLQNLTFVVAAAIGVLTLLTDLWRAEGWLVPRGRLLTPASWQAILAGLFLLTFLAWAWFAFLRPPTFGKANAKRFARTLYRVILRGSPAELAVIADELTYSARALVRYATDKGRLRNCGIGGEGDAQQRDPPTVEAYANDLLLLIADKRFCRAIVESSPATALVVFQEMGAAKKYGIQVETFAKNIINEALANKDSFLYHEATGYESGLIGYHKPLSQAMFSNYEMVETIGTMLDPDVRAKSKWDADQWEAYCRVVLITFRDYADKQFSNHSFVLYRAKGYIERSASDLYKLNALTNIPWDHDTLARLRVIVKFIEEAVKILDRKGVPDYLRLRVRNEHGHPGDSFYDHLASMIVEVIFAAAAVRSPRWECWVVQHNSLWSELFNFHHLSSPAGKVVKFKVRRLLYDEVADLKRFPNFKGARFLSLCLNVMGLSLRKDNYDRDSRALHIAILSWTKKNYAWLHSYNSRVAEACLVDGMSYDVENLRIVQTHPVEGLRREPQYVYLKVNPAPEKETAA